MLFCNIIIYKEVEMEFFRENKKLIVGIIALSFILWTVGVGVLMLFPPTAQ